MARRRKIFVSISIGAVVVVGGLFFLYLLPTWLWVGHKVSPSAWRVGGIINCYINASSGSFPSSQEELEEKGYLQERKTHDGVEYSIRFLPEDQDSWQDFPAFAMFTVKYGVNLEDIEPRDGRLYDAASGAQVLLISDTIGGLDGPYKGFLQQTYEQISWNWYEQMIKYCDCVPSTGSASR